MRDGLRRSRRMVVGLAAVLCAFGAAAAPSQTWDPSDVYREIYPADGVELGRGWYQNEGTAATSGCTNGRPEALKSSELAYTFTEVTSREQIYKALHINAAARYGVVKASASLADRFTADRSTISVLATVDVRKFGVYLAPPKGGRIELDKNALDALRAATKSGNEAMVKALRDFFGKCGDSYVSAIENGATYNSQFSVATSAESRSKLIGANVSGGFGRFKASLSMSKEAIDVVTDGKVRVATSQSGGPFDVPTTSAEAYNRIRQFAAAVTADNSTPLTIVLRPYESHPDFPAAYQGMRTAPQTVSHLAGLVDRFDDLADAYRSALFGRHAYQFPLQTIDLKSPACTKFTGTDAGDRCLMEELAASARIADTAAACLGRVVLWCRDDAVCNVRRIPANTEAAQCLSQQQLSDLIAKDVASQPAAAATLDDSQKTRLVDRVVAAFSRKSDGPVGTVSLDIDGVVRLYLRHLASLPFANGIGAAGADMTAVATTCALYATVADCSINGLPSLGVDSSRLLAINQGLREWVFTERLGKAVGGACEVGAGHPLCKASSSALDVAAELTPLYAAPRRFPGTEAAPVAPPAPAPPAQVVKVVEKKSPCFGGGGAGRQSGCFSP